MANFPPIPFQTTLAAAIGADDITLSVAASTGFTSGSYLVIGNEVILISTANTTTNTHAVKRGMKGTKAVRHASGAIVSLGAASTFGPNVTSGVDVAGYTGDFTAPKLPIGRYWVDPETGYVYQHVSAAAALIAGEWVAISAAGAATLMTATSKGRVGIVVESTGLTSRLCWVLVSGSYASALFSSMVTTAIQLASWAAFPTAWTSGTGASCGNDIRIHRATCTVAPTTNTTPYVGGGDYGTAYIDFPWVNGNADEFQS